MQDDLEKLTTELKQIERKAINLPADSGGFITMTLLTLSHAVVALVDRLDAINNRLDNLDVTIQDSATLSVEVEGSVITRDFYAT